MSYNIVTRQTKSEESLLFLPAIVTACSSVSATYQFYDIYSLQPNINLAVYSHFVLSFTCTVINDWFLFISELFMTLVRTRQ
jgi:hypothetical protein